MNKQFVLVLAIFALLSFSFAASMWYDFTNTYATDGNGALKVFIDSGTGSGDPGYDVNVIVYVDENSDGIPEENFILSGTTEEQSDGTYVDFDFNLNYLGNLGENGLDLSIVIQDLINIQTDDLEFYQPGFKDVDINWHTSPPFDGTTDVNFNFVYYDENGTEVAFDGNFDVTLFDSNNTTINSFAVTGNNTVTIDDSNISATGKYYLSIGDENKGGYKIFTFDVKSFDLIAYVVDSSETQKFMYDATDDLNLIVFAILNDNMITLSGVTYTIDNNSNSISSITKRNSVNIGPYSAGKHNVKVDANYLGDIQTVYFDFFVGSYSAEAYLKKNSKWGGKEKFVGAFAPSSPLLIYYRIKNTSTNATLTDINTNEKCTNLLSGITYVTEGFIAKKTVTGYTVDYDSIESACSVAFNTPANSGDYKYNIDINNNYNEYTAFVEDPVIKLTVQKYLIFMNPVDPTANDLAKAGKFVFYDENIGFLVSVINLTPSGVDDLNVSGISAITLIRQGVSSTVTSYDYNYLNRLLVVNKSEITNGGMLELEAIFDTNSVDQSTIVSRTQFKKKTFKITVDLNKESMMEGPPFVSSDENVVLEITAKTSSNSSLAYATLSLSALKRFDDLTDLNVDELNVDDGLTDDSGTGYLNLLTLDNGIYEVTVDVNDGQSSDSATAMFMVKSFMAVALSIGDNNLEELYILKNTTPRLCVFVFGEGNKQAGGNGEFIDINQYTIPTANNGHLKLFLETKDGKPQLIDATLSSDSNCSWSRGGFTVYGRKVTLSRTNEFPAGWYHMLFDVNKGGVIDSAQGMFVVKDFNVSICKLGEQSCGELIDDMGQGFVISPDTNYPFTMKNNSGQEVTMTVDIMADKSGDLIFEDLNWYYDGNLKAPIPATGGNKDINLEIPSDLDLGEYRLIFDVNNGGAENSVFDRFAVAKRFLLVIPAGMGNREARYTDDWRNGGFDTNIEDMDSFELSQYCDGTLDIGSITYDRYISWSDFNRLMLVDLDEPRIYIDLNRDCNFVNDLQDGNVTPLDKRVLSDITVDENNPVITNVGVTGIRYIVVPKDMAYEEMMHNNWLGDFDVDRNTYLPLGVLNLDEEPIEGVQVAVGEVYKIDFMNKSMDILTEGTDYNVYIDSNTDVNGIVLIKFITNTIGEYQITLSLSEDGKTEELMPWEGPGFSMKKFDIEYGIIGLDRWNGAEINVDVNENADGNIINWSGNPFVGVINEADLNIDVDRDGNKTKIYYIVFEGGSTYMIDDDTNFYGGSGEDGMKLSGLKSDWPTCLGDYNESQRENDCSTGSIIMDPDTVTYDKELDLMVARNGDFQDVNSNDNNKPLKWSISLQSQYIALSDGNGGSGYGAKFDINNTSASISTNEPVYGLIDDDDNYHFSFCAKMDGNADEPVDVNVSFFVWDVANADFIYNFTSNLWEQKDWNNEEQDAAFDDSNYSKVYVVDSNTDWNCDYTFDMNMGSSWGTIDPETNILFRAGPVLDHNVMLDDVSLDGNFTASTLTVYNKWSHRFLPANMGVEGQHSDDRRIWVDANTVDVNVMLETKIKNRDLTELNASDMNVSAKLIRETDCTEEMMGMKQYIGSYNADKNFGDNLFGLNFGDMSSQTTGRCTKYNLRIDISALIDGLTYRDTKWDQFFVRDLSKE